MGNNLYGDVLTIRKTSVMDVRDEARRVIDESNLKLAGVLTSFFNDNANKSVVPEFYYEAAVGMTMMPANMGWAGGNALFEIAVDAISEHYPQIYADKPGDVKALFDDIISAQQDRFVAVAQVGVFKKENGLPARDEERHQAVIDGFVATVTGLGGDGVFAEKLMRNMADYCADVQDVYNKDGTGPVAEALAYA